MISKMKAGRMTTAILLSCGMLGSVFSASAAADSERALPAPSTTASQAEEHRFSLRGLLAIPLNLLIGHRPNDVFARYGIEQFRSSQDASLEPRQGVAYEKRSTFLDDQTPGRRGRFQHSGNVLQVGF